MRDLIDFRVSEPLEVFKDARVLPLFFQSNLVDQTRVVKVFEDDLHANIKVFYYQYLKICFESQTSDFELYIQKIEQTINNPDFRFFFFNDDDPSIFNDAQFKNLIRDFFGILSQASISIESALNIYPIMDAVFIYFYRSLLILLGKSEFLDSYIDRDTLFNTLTTYFAVKVTNHELCIKFVDTDIFVYEENPRRVYLAYMDHERNPDTRVIPVYRDQLQTSPKLPFQTTVDDSAMQIEEEARQAEQRQIFQQRVEEEEKNRKTDQERQKAQNYRIEQEQAEQERRRVEQQIKRLEQENKRTDEERKMTDGRKSDPIKTESSATIPYSNRGQVKINQSYIDSEFIDYTAAKGVDLNGLLKAGMKKSTTLEAQASQAESLMYLQSDRTSPPQSETKAYESNLEKSSSPGYNVAYSVGYNAGYNAEQNSGYNSGYNSASFKSGVNLSMDYTNGNKVTNINTSATGASLNKMDSFFQSSVPKGTGAETKGFYTSVQAAARLSSTMQEYQRPERKSKKNHPLGLNVSDEFTDSFTKKAMCEPHRSNVTSMRARARENRASIGHFAI